MLGVFVGLDRGGSKSESRSDEEAAALGEALVTEDEFGTRESRARSLAAGVSEGVAEEVGSGIELRIGIFGVDWASSGSSLFS